MANSNPEKELETGAKQTPIEGKTRTTGQGSKTETRDGAETEAPGNDGTKTGSPNQGTEAR
ncbi:MAG: hypothetical protein AAFQ63_12555 [Cyanobacteria bacterium J06621_11]